MNKECKTPRCILEEALSDISLGQVTVVEVGDETIGAKKDDKGWVKGSEDVYSGYDVEGKRQLVGVCSIGAIALASLDKLNMGDVIKPGSFASYAQVVKRDKNTLLAGMYLMRAMYEYASANVREEFFYVINDWLTNGGTTWEEIFETIRNGTKRYLNPDKLDGSWSMISRANVSELSGECIAEFNDRDETTWDDIIHCFQNAIKLAIADEENA